MNLLPRTIPGSKGSAIQQLQSLLYEAGTYRPPLTGVYDDRTLSAVKEFQISRGILQDGIAGSQTLMYLYNFSDRFGTPKLMAGIK